MYKEGYFYQLIDVLRYDLFRVAYRNKIRNNKRLIIKIFNLSDEFVVVENFNFNDEIVYDNRLDKTRPLEEYDLIFLKVMERYESDVELPNKIYERIDGVGIWARVKIEGYNPNDKLLRPFYLKKTISFDDLARYTKTQEELKYLQNFYNLVGGDKFTHPKVIKDLFNKKCYNKIEVK